METRRVGPRERRWMVPTAVLGAAMVLVAVVLFQQGGQERAPTGAGGASPSTQEQDNGQGEIDLRDAERRDADDLLSAGDVDAPVGLVVFSDYQCPFCASWSHETLPELRKYVEAGNLRIEWRDVNVFGAPSERAARASYAAALQDHFWEYHDALFAGGEKRSKSELTQDALISLAEELELDPQRFATDMKSSQTRAQIDANASQGLELGAHSTPAFVVDGKPIVGAQPTEVFVDAVDTALDAKGE